jgi:hypothetical protein
MVRRNEVADERATRVEHAPRARGGVSLGGVITGVVVAFGAIFLLSALVGGVIAATGLEDNLDAGVAEAGVAGGIAFVIAQFLAYLWGGYTAGRMARGAGAVNGFLVPLVALLLAVIVGGIAAALGAASDMNLPFQDARLPLEENVRIDYGIAYGIAALVAMFLGGILGGLLGARWHTKLERRAADEVSGTHLTERRETTREPAPVEPTHDTRDTRTVGSTSATTPTTTERTEDTTTRRPHA